MAKYAIVIAVEKYADKVPPVLYAESDADAVSAAFVALDFEVTLLKSAQATKARIESAIRKRATALTEDDTVFVFYAGHGFAKNETNYLTSHDFDHKDWVGTSVDLRAAVFEPLRKSKAKRVVLFLDACQSGMPADPNIRDIISGLNDEELEEFVNSSEFYVCFSACKADETSYSDGSVKHGIWTHHLLEAIEGRASSAMIMGIVTSSTLQDHLATQVPLTVRTVRKAPDVQTPWACGAMNKQFVIADLKPILAARKAAKLAGAKQITEAILRGEKTQGVRYLSGFHKGHTVPDRVSNTTIEFVRRIAEEDLKEHLDKVFEGLKGDLGYKRNEIREQSNGFVTPHFEYQVTIGLDDSDPSVAIWHHRVSKMVDKDVIFSDEFAQTFGKFLNTAEYEFTSDFDVEAFIDLIEGLESGEIEVDYKRGEPECDLYIEGFDGVLHLTPVGVSVSGVPGGTPRKLLEAIPQAQKLIAAKKDIPLLPL